MSHMIYAETTNGDTEIAEVNTTSAARDLYQLLDATEFDSGCSGSGESKTVSQKSIYEALLKATDYGAKRFLADVLAKTNGDDVKVVFA